MEKFHFQLEKVLQYRMNLTKESERLLLMVAQQCQTLLSESQRIKEEQRHARMAYSFSGDISLMHVLAAYDERLTEEYRQKVDEFNILDIKRLSLQKEYLVRLKEQQVLDRLKESKLTDYKIKKQRYDQQVLDDIIASHYKTNE